MHANSQEQEIETSSVPEFKARIERVFQTFQNRLPKLFELNGIHTIEEANKYISKYLKKFNNQFALPINNTKSVFTNQLEEEKINLILIVKRNIPNMLHPWKAKSFNEFIAKQAYRQSA